MFVQCYSQNWINTLTFFVSYISKNINIQLLNEIIYDNIDVQIHFFMT